MTNTQRVIVEYYIIKGMGWKFIQEELGISKFELKQYYQRFQGNMHHQREHWLKQHGWEWEYNGKIY